jgi:hypothetical protein
MDDFKEKETTGTLKGSTRSHSLENSFWKGLWASRKVEYEMDYKIISFQILLQINEVNSACNIMRKFEFPKEE